MVEWITDAEDPRIADYRDVRERDLVGRRGLFVAEGAVVLRGLLESPFARPRSILVAEARLPSLSDLLARVPPGTPVFVASQVVMDTIVGFPIHRGILALGETPPPRDPAPVLAGVGAGALVLALSGIANHDNMGGLFRNAAAFGVDAVVLDAGCCDPFYRKALRVSVGAVLQVPQVRLVPGADMVAGLQAAGERIAVVLGAEGPGLAPEVLARCETVRIPMAAGFDSLNVATTSGIVLHHLRSRSGDAG
jgi:tRNA G18 (ribose-2'-O)-methylase SpoU